MKRCINCGEQLSEVRDHFGDYVHRSDRRYYCTGTPSDFHHATPQVNR